MSRVNVTLYNKEGTTQTGLNPATVADQVEIPAADGSPSDVAAEIVKLREGLGAAVDGGIVFKGALTNNNGLPTVSYKAGWQYTVQEAGTYAGKVCEVGDLVLCIRTYASGSASNADWTVIQANIVGAVTGPASSVANRVAVFDGTSGKIIKDSGYTIARSVPADAQFTDTTYAEATTSAAGLMSATDKTKLGNIEAGADVTDAANVAAAGAVMKTGSSDDLKQGSTNLYMTSAERTKLGGITAGAQPNQNAFASVKVGDTTIAADTTGDTLTLEAGNGITLKADTANDKVTVEETYIDSCMVNSLDAVPANLRNGGLIILRG